MTTGGGTYQTLADAYGTMSTVHVSVPFVNGSTTFSNVSFFLPAGSVITSAHNGTYLSFNHLRYSVSRDCTRILSPTRFWRG